MEIFSNIEDVTFVIPLKVDSIDRLENLLFTTNYLLHYFDAKIIVCEIDERNKKIAQNLLRPEIMYVFHYDPDPIFYRTRYINQIIKDVTTPIVAIWDADVIVSKEQIINSVELLRNGKAEFVYPYKNVMYNVPSIVKNIYAKTYDFEVLNKFSSGFHKLYWPNALGGGFFANLSKYVEAGMENENYYGWGLEDGERYHRWKRLDYKVEQIDGVLFHFDHSRGVNSVFHTDEQAHIKRKEQFRIRNIPQSQLRKEVDEWHKNI